MLPRAGGVLDQPGNEMMYLGAVLDAFANYDELESRRNKARSTNRSKSRESA